MWPILKLFVGLYLYGLTSVESPEKKIMKGSAFFFLAYDSQSLHPTLAKKNKIHSTIMSCYCHLLPGNRKCAMQQ